MYSTQQAGEQTWEALKKEVARLGQLDGYPKPEFQPEAFRELVIALQNSETLEEARNFIDDVMMCEMVCPKPSQLREMIRSAKEATAGSPSLNQIDEWKREAPPMLEALQHYRPFDDERCNEHLALLKSVVARKLPKDHPDRVRLREMTAELKIAYNYTF